MLWAMTGVRVNVDNFARAESDRMFAAVLADSGGVNRWMHNRAPTRLDHQPVIRMNRDTLYSAAVVDISDGATLRLPDAGGRYLSAMVVNNDHYINAIYHDAGDYPLTIDDFDTPFVLVGIRVLVDPADPDDTATANALQDQLAVSAGSARPFSPPDYDPDGFDATRTALRELARGLDGFHRAFGRRDAVDPVRHLLASAAAFGGLPDSEAQYLNVDPGLPAGHYQLTVREVPVDGFWSISLYDAAGYFPIDAGATVSVNNLTADRNADGSITVNFGGDADLPNRLPTVEGWNYLIRLYRPRAEIVDGSWTFPSAVPAGVSSGQQ